jgi:predicted AlkP superfamily phosphohydrolase/phosphomutase
MGLNGIYLNLQGRESQGIVAPGDQADALLKKLAAKLQDARDPDTGQPMIGGVTLSHRDFHGSRLEAAPDIIVGYMPGYRSSWQTTLGAVPAVTVVNNTEAWRADHCILAKFVPGVLISNRKSSAADPHLYDLTVSLLHLFGIEPDPGMIGRSVY